MTPLLLSRFEDLSAEEKEVVNDVCEKFEALRQRGASERAEDHLGCISGQVRTVLFRELMLLEYSYRLRAIESLEEDASNASAGQCDDRARDCLTACATKQIHRLSAENSSIPLPEYVGYLEAEGRFRVLRVLGRGGFGIVYEAEATWLGRIVAVKVPLAGPGISEEFKERFFREGRAMSCLSHPNIARILDVGMAGPLCYIASEFVAGSSLSEWLSEQKGNLAVHTAAELVLKLAQAMEYAHQAGVLHCDLKPSNVLMALDEPLNLKIVDFGLARLVDESPSISQDGQILGTPLYMAPEQAAGKRQQLGAATDVHALGVILYELLTGHPPFEPGTIEEVLCQVRWTEAPRMRKKKLGIPADLEALCLKCLEKQPKNRYASANELADDLDRFIKGQPTLARPSGPIARANKWVRTHPRLMASGTAILLIAIVSASGWYEAVLARQEGDRQLRHIAEQDSQLRQSLEKESAARGEAEKNAGLATKLVGEMLERWEKLYANRELAATSETAQQERQLRQDLEAWLPVGRTQLSLNPLDRHLSETLSAATRQLPGFEVRAGKSNTASQVLLEEIGLGRQLVVLSPDNNSFLARLAIAQMRLADLYSTELHPQAALDAARDAEKTVRRLVQVNAEPHWKYLLADCVKLRSNCLRELGRVAEANAIAGSNRIYLETMLQHLPKGAIERQLLVHVLVDLDDLAEACSQARQLAESRPDDWWATWELARCLTLLARKDGRKAAFEEAARSLNAAIKVVKHAQTTMPFNLLFRMPLPEIECFLMECHLALGNNQEAEKTAMEGYKCIQEMVLKSPGYFVPTGYHVELLQRIPRIYIAAGNREEGVNQAKRTIDLFATAIGKRRLSYPVESYFDVMSAMMAILRQSGDLEGANAAAKRMCAVLEGWSDSEPKSDRVSALFATNCTDIAKNSMRTSNHGETLNQLREAVKWEQKAFDSAPSGQRNASRLDDRMARLARFLILREQWEEAAKIILARETLWKTNAKGLRQVSDSLRDLCHKLESDKPQSNPEIPQLNAQLRHEAQRIDKQAAALGELQGN